MDCANYFCSSRSQKMANRRSNFHSPKCIKIEEFLIENLDDNNFDEELCWEDRKNGIWKLLYYHDQKERRVFAAWSATKTRKNSGKASIKDSFHQTLRYLEKKDFLLELEPLDRRYKRYQFLNGINLPKEDRSAAPSPIVTEPKEEPSMKNSPPRIIIVMDSKQNRNLAALFNMMEQGTVAFHPVTDIITEMDDSSVLIPNEIPVESPVSDYSSTSPISSYKSPSASPNAQETFYYTDFPELPFTTAFDFPVSLPSDQIEGFDYDNISELGNPEECSFDVDMLLNPVEPSTGQIVSCTQNDM